MVWGWPTPSIAIMVGLLIKEVTNPQMYSGSFLTHLHGQTKFGPHKWIIYSGYSLGPTATQVKICDLLGRCPKPTDGC